MTLSIAEHERILDEHHTIAILHRFRCHGLRDPIGIGELFERVGMGVFQHRDGIHFERLVADVGDLDIAHFNRCIRWNEDRHFGANAMEFAEDARVAKTYTAFVFVICIERRNEEGRKNFVAPSPLSPLPCWDRGFADKAFRL